MARLVKIIILLLVAAHLLGGFWYATCAMRLSNQHQWHVFVIHYRYFIGDLHSNSWVDETIVGSGTVREADLTTKYFISVYFVSTVFLIMGNMPPFSLFTVIQVVVTLSTTGYGDIHAVNAGGAYVASMFVRARIDLMTTDVQSLGSSFVSFCWARLAPASSSLTSWASSPPSTNAPKLNANELLLFSSCCSESTSVCFGAISIARLPSIPMQQFLLFWKLMFMRPAVFLVCQLHRPFVNGVRPNVFAFSSQQGEVEVQSAS